MTDTFAEGRLEAASQTDRSRSGTSPALAVEGVRKIADAVAEALACARSAAAAIEDTGETRQEHSDASRLHSAVRDLIAEIASTINRAHNYARWAVVESACVRHALAASAHEFAERSASASADDPHEDGSGIELAAQATLLALQLSKRAAVASEAFR